MREYLYVFGYEDSSDKKANDATGTDFESTGVVRIMANGEDDALAWGREVSERFVAWLFGDKVSWKDAGFSAWIESEPDADLVTSATKAPLVKVGELPDFHSLKP